METEHALGLVALDGKLARSAAVGVCFGEAHTKLMECREAVACAVASGAVSWRQTLDIRRGEARTSTKLKKDSKAAGVVMLCSMMRGSVAVFVRYREARPSTMLTEC